MKNNELSNTLISKLTLIEFQKEKISNLKLSITELKSQFVKNINTQNEFEESKSEISSLTLKVREKDSEIKQKNDKIQ